MTASVREALAGLGWLFAMIDLYKKSRLLSALSNGRNEPRAGAT